MALLMLNSSDLTSFSVDIVVISDIITFDRLEGVQSIYCTYFCTVGQGFPKEITGGLRFLIATYKFLQEQSLASAVHIRLQSTCKI